LQAFVLIAILAIEVNLSLFVFNLLPIPPLDGSRIVRNMLPYNAVVQYDRIGGWVSWLLMIFLGRFIMGLFLGPLYALVYFGLRLV
jgi:Zn-dependent protease